MRQPLFGSISDKIAEKRFIADCSLLRGMLFLSATFRSDEEREREEKSFPILQTHLKREGKATEHSISSKASI